MSTRLRAVLAHQWEKACDLGVPGLLAALIAIAQVTVLRHTSSSLAVSSLLLLAVLVGFSARRWRRREATRAAVREHMNRMEQPAMRRGRR